MLKPINENVQRWHLVWPWSVINFWEDQHHIQSNISETETWVSVRRLSYYFQQNIRDNKRIQNKEKSGECKI